MRFVGTSHGVDFYEDDEVPEGHVYAINLRGKFMIKDSGKRQKLPGMVRDVTDDKIDYTLVLDGPLIERLARHLTDGAKKYSKRNWMGAHTQAEYDRFRESLLRHLIQYLRGDSDEDHFAAIVFNLNGMEYVKERMTTQEGKDRLFITPDGWAPDRRVGLEDRRKCYKFTSASRRLDVIHGRRKEDALKDFTKYPVCDSDTEWESHE